MKLLLRLAPTSRAILTACFLFFTYLVVRAFTQLDLEGYDFLYYHLPFALKMYGATTYQLFPWLGDLYEAYPPIAHAVQGFLVWSTGYAPLANSIGALAVLLLLTTVHLGEGRKGSAGFFLLAFLSVPLLVRHTWLGLIDLWLGCFLALSFYGFYKWETHKRLSWLWRTGLFLAVACYSKYQAWPVAAVILVGLLYSSLSTRNYEASKIIVVIGVVCAGWPLYNWIRFSNPCYPYPLPFFPELPNTVNFDRIASRFMPPWMDPYPKSLRFVISFLELSRLNFRAPQMIWANAGWQPGEIKNFHYQLGGMSMYSMVLLIPAAYYSYRKKILPKLTAIVFVTSVTAVSMLSQSHEMRYWLFIPLVLCIFFSLLMTTSVLTQRQRYQLQLMLALSAVYTIANTECFRLDYRPMTQKIPDEAIEFWQMSEAHPIESVIVIDVPWEKAIFWSGPKFNRYRVVLPEFKP